MNQDFVLALALPLTLFLMMFSMGTTLRPGDFSLLARRPFPVVVGLGCQLILLPLMAVLVLKPFAMSPEIYAGFVILALSPGGTTSNVFTYLAGGCVALSISLTALVSLIAPFSLPLAANFLLNDPAIAESRIVLPLLPTIARLLVITLLPVTLGMLLRRFNPGFCLRRERLLTRLPFVMLLCVIAGIIRQNWESMPEFLSMTGVPALLLASVSLLAAYLVARSLRLADSDARAVAIETSIQNGGTAMLVTGTILNNPAMTVAPVMYGILMLAPLFLVLALRRFLARTEAS